MGGLTLNYIIRRVVIFLLTVWVSITIIFLVARLAPGDPISAMVAQASARMLVIVDDSKLVGRLGERAPVPVEVVPFGHASHMAWLRDLGAEPRLRAGGNGDPYRTDNGNLILDCRFDGGIEDPPRLEGRLAHRAGVVESGLFLGVACEAVLAGAGGVRRLERTGA